jgi:hypothetical protein
MTERLDERAAKKVAGPAWEPLRATFHEASRILLSVSPKTVSELTTIYVKFCVSTARRDVFAVAWLKNSKQLVFGFSLPEEAEAPELGPAPQGMTYKGLTKYLTVRPGDSLPVAFADWARLAYETVAGAG